MKAKLLLLLGSCLFSAVTGDELRARNPSYGLGKHRYHNYEQAEIQVISSIIKNGYEYSVKHNGNLGIDISRVPESNNQSEHIATFNYRLSLGLHHLQDQWIVDVYASESEIAFIMASGSGYQYFKVTNQEVAAPNGYFMCEREGFNSATWKVIQLQREPSFFGEGYEDWSHVRHVQSVKLLGVNSIEVKAPNDVTAIFTVEQGLLKKAGNVIEGVSIYNPMLATEAELSLMFSQVTTETSEEVRFVVSFFKGGKNFILNLLNQFSDQNAANQIRVRILEAYPPE